MSINVYFLFLLLLDMLNNCLLDILQIGIHPSAAEEFVTMRSVTRRVSPGKPKTNL